MKTKINRAIRQVLQQFGKKYFIEEALKSNFTIDVAGNIVMQTNKLIELFEADEYWQSKTEF